MYDIVFKSYPGFAQVAFADTCVLSLGTLLWKFSDRLVGISRPFVTVGGIEGVELLAQGAAVPLIVSAPLPAQGAAVPPIGPLIED